MREYLERLIETIISAAMHSVGCVVIEGPKWCGKSTTGQRFAKSVIELAKPNIYRQYKIFSDLGDPILLKGEKPLMFDEWQKIPELWDYIREDIDENGLRGQYILTGSTKPQEDEKRHSGTGRIIKIVMRPMSLWESRESTGQVSLRELFDKPDNISGKNNHDLRDIAFLLCRGGWPQSVLEKEKDIALMAARNYISTLVEQDINEADGKKKNPARARAILRAYARNLSTPAKISTIKNDIEANEAGLDPRTLDSYINSFKNLYVIEDIEAWSPKLRSKSVLRTTNTRQLIDPSLATAAIDASPEDIIADIKTFGFLFESLCIRDLRIYAQSLGGSVYNYRDSSGLETDAIIHLKDGKWGAIEVEIGGEDSIELAAKHLIELKDKVDTEKMNQPAFLMVMTASRYAYRRSDGVYVVPIGCLKN